MSVAQRDAHADASSYGASLLLDRLDSVHFKK